MSKAIKMAAVASIIFCVASVIMLMQDRSHCECGVHATREQHNDAVALQKIKDDLREDFLVYRRFMESNGFDDD
ncbi:MAG TPA: hypothetical protein VMW88_04200 [Thermoplasmata archaeon]|nr:hypothetical protein [Thermoplasmata archaeon]